MSGEDDPKRPPGAEEDFPDEGDLPAADEGDLPAADEGDLPAVDEVDMREILRQALQAPPAAPPNLLRGVQRRLRTRSRGKFYADGWSTSRSPRSTYLMTSLLMLALIALVFLVLIPWGSGVLP